MQKSTFELEEKLIAEGYELIIGVDEAGRGPLAGPVVACAAAIKCHPDPPTGGEGSRTNFNNSTSAGFFASAQNDKAFNLIRDSKMLSEKQRESLFDFIHENFYVGVGICDHHTIDRVNILEASFLAMKSAVGEIIRIMNQESGIMNKKSLIHNSKFIILLDGNKKIPNFSMEQQAIVSGDKLVKSISAASIIAKATRDRIMKEMHKKYPEYNFLQHKGYGTKIHMDALKKYGPCEIHRKSFRPVRKSMVNFS
ncbi:MAG TPA: ribonuclease HII [Candidatus Moranbacteria bacterium]|nr:ribonuclease HII [Candidatus Moranbacteria bacterium]